MNSATIPDTGIDTGQTTQAPASGAAKRAPLNAFDLVAVGAGFLLILALRILYIHALRWHSDEPQHMHVVWGWANGKLPYKDVFDNHSPLFGFLFSPLFRLVGERDDIVEAMRWFMLPLLGVSLWCLYKLGEVTFSRRVGLWGAFLGALYPNWFLKMVEFRTDVLWTTLWLVTLVVLVTGRLNPRRMFFAGLALGATFSVSMKTTLMFLTLCAAGIVTGIFWMYAVRSREVQGSRHEWLARFGAVFAGVIIIPGAFVGFFAANGALEKMYYCIIQHNLTGSHGAGRILHRFHTWQSLLIPVTLAIAATLLPAFRENPHRAARRLFLLCVAGLFSPILEGVWTNVTSQDYMPVWPLYGAIVGVAIVLGGEWLGHLKPWARAASYPVLIAVAAFEFWWIYLGGFRFHRDADEPAPAPISLWGRPNGFHQELIREATTLTDPGEFVMDSKGETVYRPRPYWYVLETLTRKRLYSGALVDDLPQRLVDSHTAVSTISDRMMPGSQKFIADHYVPVGSLYVLGRLMPEAADGVYAFDTIIPERYTFLTKGGVPSGTLDGQRFDGPRMLEPGRHEFRRSSGKGSVAFIWARAVERGFSPYKLQYPAQ